MNDTKGIAGRFLSLVIEGIIIMNPDCIYSKDKLIKFTQFMCDAGIAERREEMEAAGIPMKEGSKT